MRPLTTSPSCRKLALLAASLWIVAPSRTNADDADTILIQDINIEAAAAAPAPTPAEKVDKAKPVVKNAKQKETSRVVRLRAPITFPSLYPNPLAFNLTWYTISDKTLTDARVFAARQKALARRAVLMRRAAPNPAAQNAIQQQVRQLMEPMFKTEISFVARTAKLSKSEREKFAADGKEWFEKFLGDFVKNQDPNQQQMLLQGLQGVWFGNQQQRAESPRDAVRAGMVKLAKEKLPKEKADAYADESRKREDFARQAAVDSLVERLDEKVKLSPNQWQKITKSLNEHWDKKRDPQLESFALNNSMWPGAPDQWVQPELTPAQQAVLRRVNTNSGQMFIHGGIFGQMFGGEVAVFDDSDVDQEAAPAGKAKKPADAVNPDSEAE